MDIKPTSDSQQTDEPARIRVSSSTSSNQLFIADALDLPDTTFHISLDNYSAVGENVTIGDRNSSIDIGPAGMAVEIQTSTPAIETPETPIVEPFTPPAGTPIADPCTPPPETPPVGTPKAKDEVSQQDKIQKVQNLLKLSLIKNNDDVFVKPSPVMEVMSPARMLQFEVDACATPTMKRAVINFDFFKQNKFDEYFDNDPEEVIEGDDNEDPKEGKEKHDIIEVSKEESTENPFEEAAVIVKAKDTVRHEIGYGASRYQVKPYHTHTDRPTHHPTKNSPTRRCRPAWHLQEKNPRVYPPKYEWKHQKQ